MYQVLYKRYNFWYLDIPVCTQLQGYTSIYCYIIRKKSIKEHDADHHTTIIQYIGEGV